MDTGSSLADMIDTAAVAFLADAIGRVHPPFEKAKFKRAIAKDLPTLALTQRAKRIATELRVRLPDDFPDAVAILVRSLGPVVSRDGTEAISSFRYLPLLNFVGLYGLDHLDVSLDALEHMTCSFSAEFDIRPFLVRHPKKTLARMQAWTQHADWRVRRLASEGSRPRLPWGLRLKAFVQDPSPVLKILEKLRDDPNLIVRRSVANNLNDIAKDHPDVVTAVLKRWSKSKSAGTQWIIRHALRTLIKQGHPDAMKLLGFTSGGTITVNDFQLSPPTLRLGGRLTFSFTLRNDHRDAAQLCVDYRLHHRRANGGTSPKVFKLCTKRLAPGEAVEITRHHAIVPITTRRYYPGHHQLDILINGQPQSTAAFELIV